MPSGQSEILLGLTISTEFLAIYVRKIWCVGGPADQEASRLARATGSVVSMHYKAAPGV